ncbi:MAG TPA: NAD(P)H-hydrate epimerase [bacterium]|nr:NAD(P)H-hydrate epimerase [bacterium]HOL67572.1 NAD(P)H-hydrate epimerase [bacterium]
MKRLILKTEEIYKRERAAVEMYGLPLIVLMENAGHQAASVVSRWLKKNRKERVLVVCGRGNNGGDGMVTARYLINAGFDVRTILAGEEKKISALAFTNYQILCKMKATIIQQPGTNLDWREFQKVEVVVDALLGIGLHGRVREPELTIIKQINALKKAVFSLDVPSGLDADSGVVLGEAVHATTTICFGFLKPGLFTGAGPQYSGKVKLVDIGFPWPLYQPDWEAETADRRGFK